MKRFLINKSFFKVKVKLSGCLVLLFIFNLTLHAQPEKTNAIHVLDSIAGQEYNFFLENKENTNYKKALEHLQNYANLSDSINKLRRIDQLTELNARYENDKKAHEVQLLIQENMLKDLQINRNRYLIFAVTGVTLLIWLVIVMIIRQGRMRANQKALVIEQTLLRSQMNPHFIFNALTNIQSYVVRGDIGLSLRYLDHFSALIGTILDSSGKKVIPLATELTTISNYFELQQLRFGDKLGFEINVDESLDPSTVMLPPMMVQPLIENAIEHGIKPKAGVGRVEVRFQIADFGLRIEVEDDGVGRNYRKGEEGNKSSNHAGLALVILKERLESLKTGRLEIQDLLDDDGNGCGTISRLLLPLIIIDS